MRTRDVWLIGGALAAGLAGGYAGSRLGDAGADVRGYLLAHPEVIPEAMKRLEVNGTAKLVADNRRAIETPFAGAWAGNPRGDVTLVMFTDYACGYCRQSAPDVERLLREDRRLKVVWRELPVLGPESVAAARAALGAAAAGRYLPFHRAMFASGRPGADTIRAALAQANVGQPAPDVRVDREIEANLALAGRLGITGTPTFVAGDRLLTGAVGYDALRDAVLAARR